MDYNLLENLQFCKEIVDGYTTFLQYTHIPPAILALLLGVFVVIRNRKLASAWLLLALATVFALWTTTDYLIWMTYDRATPMLFLWSMIGILSSLLFALTYLFVFTLVTGRSVPLWLSITWAVLLMPVVIFAPTSANLWGFDVGDCVALEGTWYLYYYHALGVVTALALPLIPFFRRKGVDSAKLPLGGTTLAIIGAELFVLAFLITSFLASYLVEAGVVPDFGLEQYGILAMAVFVGLLGYLIVQYHAFNLKVLATQGLVFALAGLVAAQYIFAPDMTSFWLVTLTLILTIFFGLILIDSVKREIAQREKIEALARDLEKSNKQQIILIHFITHQIKGFLTKSRNIFSMALDGDFGPVPETLKPIIEEGFKSDTKGVNTIQDILTAANIKSGKVTYEQTAIDLKAVIEEVSKDLKLAAEAKGLAFTLDVEPATIQGDKLQLTNAFKNLIDNSIKYTLTGSVNVSLKPSGKNVRFIVSDTGVGITKEDMGKLFTEGGHGTNSQKVNVESTGFGLYIVKNIIEAHHGRVWAESEGEGKGSRFIAELPL